MAMIYSCYLIAIRFSVLRCNAALRRLQARGNAEYRKLKINHLKI